MLVTKVNGQTEGQNENEKEDSDDDFKDDGAIMRDMREERFNHAKQQHDEMQTNMTRGHGSYTEITEMEFLPSVTSSKFVICHFYHRDFERCKIVDMHLLRIAPLHRETRFIYLDAEKSPFFITKLQIQVLPCIVCFMDGVAIDRLIGFEDFNNKDDFPTLALTRRLVKIGAIKALTDEEKGAKTTKKGKRRLADESNSEDEDG